MGVPLRKIERLFSYMYSTAPTPQLGTGGAPLVGAPLVGAMGVPTRPWGMGDGVQVCGWKWHWGYLGVPGGGVGCFRVARVAWGCFGGGMERFGGAWGGRGRFELGMGTFGDILR